MKITHSDRLYCYLVGAPTSAPMAVLLPQHYIELLAMESVVRKYENPDFRNGKVPLSKFKNEFFFLHFRPISQFSFRLTNTSLTQVVDAEDWFSLHEEATSLEVVVPRRLGVKVRNMKMDFNTRGTWRRVGH